MQKLPDIIFALGGAVVGVLSMYIKSRVERRNEFKVIFEEQRALIAQLRTELNETKEETERLEQEVAALKATIRTISTGAWGLRVIPFPAFVSRKYKAGWQIVTANDAMQSIAADIENLEQIHDMLPHLLNSAVNNSSPVSLNKLKINGLEYKAIVWPTHINGTVMAAGILVNCYIIKKV